MSPTMINTIRYATESNYELEGVPYHAHYAVGENHEVVAGVAISDETLGDEVYGVQTVIHEVGGVPILGDCLYIPKCSRSIVSIDFFDEILYPEFVYQGESLRGLSIQLVLDSGTKVTVQAFLNGNFSHTMHVTNGPIISIYSSPNVGGVTLVESKECESYA